MMRPLLLLAGLALAGCGADPVLFAAPPAVTSVAPTVGDPGSRIAVAYRTVEVREVSLPAYAEAETIVMEGAGGTLMPAPGVEWADLPQRAITLDLAEVLEGVTGALVAAEPWPFESLPDARVEVRVTRLAAGVDGVFRLAGHYYVADLRGTLDRPADRSAQFQAAVSYDPEGGAAAIAAARSRAVRDLARQIASRGM
jgi:uncharacterized lipoprotein YmbA